MTGGFNLEALTTNAKNAIVLSFHLFAKQCQATSKIFPTPPFSAVA